MPEDDKPWLKSYKLGPYRLETTLAPYPELPLSSLLDQAAARHPTQTAILFQGRDLKLHQLKRHVDRLAGALAGMGLAKGERVCLFLPNCPEYIIGYWGIVRAGGVVVPTSILRSQEGLLHEVGASESRMVICRLADLERVLALRSSCAVERVLVTSNEGYDVEEIPSSLPPEAAELRAILAGDDVPPSIAIDPVNDLCQVAFTGGATGVPKGVMLTHSNLRAAYLQGIPWFMKPLLGGVAGKASVVGCIPLFHAYGGFVQQSAIGLGLRLLLLPDPRDTKALVECVLEHRPLLVPGVPTQFMRLAEAGLKRSNTMLFSGSAPLPREVVQAVKSKTGMSISEGYGLTETSTVSHVNLSAFARITGFVAKEKPGIGVPVPDTDCRLLDPLSGEPAPEGGPGELVLRGPQVMKGYWPTAGSGLTSEGWLHTGDIATMDDDGYFHIIDRIKDMVNVSGMKVYTTEVDEVLFRHPAVQMAAAFGVPDPESPGSERVMAVVRLKQGLQGQVDAEEIREFCRRHLPPYAVPKAVEFRDELPLTVTEKVFKKALRDEVIARRAKGEGL